MSDPEQTEPQGKGSKTGPIPRLLLVVGTLYALWLIWLSYVAWVNISAGNQ